MTDEDKLTDPADSQEDLTVPKDVSEQTSGTVRQPVKLGAQEQALAHPSSRDYTKYTIIGVVSVIVALALIVAGVGFGIHARNERVARERAVAAAQAECDRSIDRLTRARAGLAKRTKAERTQNALKLTDKQVADAKTLRTLRRETSDRYAAKACRTDSITVLKRNAKANRNAAEQAAAQSTRLTAAVTGVEKSKTAKDEADRKAAEKKKAEEAKKQDAAQSAPSAPASAPVKHQSASASPNTVSHSPSVRRSAPRRTYTPAPRRQAPAAPRRQAPSAPRNNGGSKSSNDDMGWTDFEGGDHTITSD